jgi:hypothetical protein
VAFLALTPPQPSFAQSTGALPPALASAGVTQSEWDAIRTEVRAEAQRAGVAEAALLAAAERAGVNLATSGRFNAAALRDAIIGQLQSQAQTIADLQDRLEVLARADDPEIAQLLTQARTAVTEGRLDDADHFLAQAEQSDLAAIAVAESRAERARARIADAIAERGGLDRIQGGGAPQSVRDAIAGYEQALRGIDRALAPRDWTRTEFNLGVAYAILAQNGDDEARVLGVAALQKAESGFDDLGEADQSARAQKLIEALQVR